VEHWERNPLSCSIISIEDQQMFFQALHHSNCFNLLLLCAAVEMEMLFMWQVWQGQLLITDDRCYKQDLK
jgi:hypothetical protein